MAGLQAKKQYIVYKFEYNSQIAESIFTITMLFYDHKIIEKKRYSSLKKILTSLLKNIKLDGLQKNIDR